MTLLESGTLNMGQVEARQAESLLSVVVLGTKDPQSIAESLMSVIEHCIGLRGADITVVLHDQARQHKNVFADLGDQVRVITTTPDASITAAWSEGINTSNSRWALLVSEDIRLTSGWLTPIFSYLADNPSCTAVTPTISYASTTALTAMPDNAEGVCLMISRKALDEGQIEEAKHIDASAVQSTSLKTPTSAPLAATPATGDVARLTGLTINAADASVSYVYSENFLHTIDLDEALVALFECSRVMHSGGVLRIAVPDMRAAVLSYLGRWKETSWVQTNPAIDTPGLMLNTMMRRGYMWDETELAVRLMQCGFVNQTVCQPGQSSNPALSGLEVNDECTLIIEATKA